MTDPTPVAFFNEAAREAHSEAIAAAFGACSSVTTDAALTAALEALPERSKAILALAGLSDEELVERVAQVLTGEPHHCYCSPTVDTPPVTVRASAVLAELGLVVADQEEANR